MPPMLDDRFAADIHTVGYLEKAGGGDGIGLRFDEAELDRVFSTCRFRIGRTKTDVVLVTVAPSGSVAVTVTV